MAPSLKDRLNLLFPDVLPDAPEKAIGGTELLKRLRKKGIPKSTTDDVLRNYFSWISKDPTSSIAKVDQGRGYYHRVTHDDVDLRKKPSTETASLDTETAARAEQREEKFRSLFMLWSVQQRQLPMHLEHTKAARQSAGLNRWKYPDVVSVRWEVSDTDENARAHVNAGARLNRDLLDVRRSLGDQPFRITSTELKVEITAPLLREYFFQCVSNSQWAHKAQLAIATNIADELVAEELRRLGTSYDVSVISFGLERDYLDNLPNAEQILKFGPERVEQEMANIIPKIVVSDRGRETLDWEHIRDLQNQHKQMKDLFSWISKCLTDYKAYEFAVWEKELR